MKIDLFGKSSLLMVPRLGLAERLLAAFAYIHPDTGELEWAEDPDPMGDCPVSVAVHCWPGGNRFRIRFWATDGDAEAARAAMLSPGAEKAVAP